MYLSSSLSSLTVSQSLLSESWTIIKHIKLVLINTEPNTHCVRIHCNQTHGYRSVQRFIQKRNNNLVFKSVGQSTRPFRLFTTIEHCLLKVGICVRSKFIKVISIVSRWKWSLNGWKWPRPRCLQDWWDIRFWCHDMRELWIQETQKGIIFVNASNAIMHTSIWFINSVAWSTGSLLLQSTVHPFILHEPLIQSRTKSSC